MLIKLKKLVYTILATVGLLGASCSKNKYVWKTEEEYYKLPKWNDKVAEFKKIKMEPHTAKLFIGDSITEGYDLQRAFADNTTVNMGIGGEYTSGLLMRMNITKQLQPAKIFLMIGINDITSGTPREVIHDRYAKIITQLKKDCPQTKVYVQSTLPTRNVGGSKESNKKYMEEVIALNIHVKTLCEIHQFTFVDLFAIFEKEGELNESYTYDGIHINNEGYNVWTKAIMQYMAE